LAASDWLSPVRAISSFKAIISTERSFCSQLAQVHPQLHPTR
jgi:hypothetical protein